MVLEFFFSGPRFTVLLATYRMSLPHKSTNDVLQERHYSFRKKLFSCFGLCFFYSNDSSMSSFEHRALSCAFLFQSFGGPEGKDDRFLV